ncbi:hypothetical protein DHEL01_v207595 [Diaporthe helianthi]|uniref:BZIP domain-containing protein n=1 Tax=Diaporthe helianthi TaxID=158607 RepID=A0A2P5HUS9_DIAHE|nr:hypothetical protein DHEL01_v207595 [Diaporthe helianthi]
MSTQHIKSQSPAASQPGSVDPLVDSMLDLSGYDDTAAQYHVHSLSHSPSLSPAASKNLTPFARPVPATVQSTQGSLLPASSAQPLTRPSHQYDLYKQQTGIVPGALANTLQVNQNNVHIGAGYQQFDIDAYFANMNDGFDFNASPAPAAMDMDFDSRSAADQSLFFADSTVNPNAIGGHEDHGLPSPPGAPSQSNVARVWPGMHQQAALAKAQAQQRQQQQIIAQQQHQQHQQRANQDPRQQRPKGSALPTDPIVEQKITQLLNSMRAKSSGPDSQNSAPLINLPRPRKDEDDMDEDERLLASEEGKKLSSKERRQLRNKVSARAFRSRRKEYITQLEAEIAGKVTENGDLRAQNRALIDENKRLSDLTRMLLSSPSFSDFLERLSTNPAAASQPAPQVDQRQEARQAPKDVNPYAAHQQVQRQQIGLTMLPEQNLEFSMVGVDAEAYNYQPQVYAVLETPEPVIDVSVLAGKSSNFVGEDFNSEHDEKIGMPLVERPMVAEEKPSAPKAPQSPVIVDEQFENDPEYALYHGSSAAAYSGDRTDSELDLGGLVPHDLFGGVETEKMLARYELIDADEEEENAARAMARFQMLSESLENTCSRLQMLTADV